MYRLEFIDKFFPQNISIFKEVRELRVAQQAGEDWAEEGGMHIFKVVNSFLHWCGALKCIFVEVKVLNIFKVVKEVGKMMMEKAYMGEPSSQRRALSNEE